MVEIPQNYNNGEYSDWPDFFIEQLKNNYENCGLILHHI